MNARFGDSEDPHVHTQMQERVREGGWMQHTRKSVPSGIGSGVPQACYLCNTQLEYRRTAEGELVLQCPQLDMDGGDGDATSSL